ncbi:MAG TPA: type II toxin-antitoxin system VapC family toxin [Smithella sp.]|jgi:tRNA(fMet)-specific endonuclease VapC|nr:type II toxin-antitoxin system VapC family toxin [Smithella sp.]HPV52412.1 type II toxin-antitoxin system VapC family toxin [Smithella sp.]
MYLLDTNICIYIINNRPLKVVNHIKKLKPYQIKLSAISLAELEYGVSKSRNRNENRRALVHFASAFDILAFDDRDAEVYGLLRADLEKKGRVIGPYDMEIAAQAITRKLILVSNNTAEFSRIPHLRLENWA